MGAALAKAGAERATPLAMATLVVAANAPDIDVASFAGGEYYALAFRRGVTHGWPALLVLPFLVAGGVLAWDRWVRRRRDPAAEPVRPGAVLALSTLGLLTHPSLDWLNTYGMRWGLPFDATWTYGDALFIIDPWVWLALGGALFLSSDPGRRGTAAWALLAALTTALIVVGVGGWPAVAWSLGLAGIVALRWRGRTRPPPSPTGRSRAALAAVTVYLLMMIGADLVARGEVEAAAREARLDTRDLMVAPHRGNPFGAEVEVRTPDGYVPGTHEWLRSPRVRLDVDGLVPLLSYEPAAALDAVDPATVDRIVAAARARDEIRHYLVWSRYPYVRVRADRDGWWVRFADARYDTTPEAGGLAGLSVHVRRSEIP